MACGDKYAHLVRTAGGLTAKRRHSSMLATEPDYGQWFEAAQELRSKVNRQWSVLRKAELEREQGTALSDDLRASIGGYVDATAAMPVPWDVWMSANELLEPGPRIDHAVDVMMMGACELEKIDEALGSIGVDAPEVPGPKATPGGASKGLGGIVDSVQTVAMIALVGAAAYGVAKLVIMARKSAPAPLAEVSEA